LEFSEVMQVLSRQLHKGAIQTGKTVLEKYSYDRTSQMSLPQAVIKSHSEREVQSILRLANENIIPVVTRGAGSSLTGAIVPITRGIVLDVSEMVKFTVVKQDSVVISEPGVVTSVLQSAVEAEGLFYPPDPASLEFSTIGGNLATNAGGARGVKYGVTRDYVRGLTVVLADGQVLNLGGQYHKNSTGYQLMHLIIGSEGTLGVITNSVLRLIPLPPYTNTLRAMFRSVETTSEAVTGIFEKGFNPNTIELMDRVSLEIVSDNLDFDLSEEHNAMIIIECDGTDKDQVDQDLSNIASMMQQKGASEVVIAKNEEERITIWHARRSVSDALAKSSPNKLVEDIVVPRSKISALVQEVQVIAKANDLTIALFGHAGDGNLHPNFLFDLTKQNELQKVEKASKEVFELAMNMGGTLSGEHGIGTLKRQFLEDAVGHNVLNLMRSIKEMFDPNNILNPQKIFPMENHNKDKTGFLSDLPFNSEYSDPRE
jgi:glycolate oxidase